MVLITRLIGILVLTYACRFASVMCTYVTVYALAPVVNNLAKEREVRIPICERNVAINAILLSFRFVRFYPFACPFYFLFSSFVTSVTSLNSALILTSVWIFNPLKIWIVM